MKKLITILAIISLASCGDINHPSEGNIVQSIDYWNPSKDAKYRDANGGHFWAPKDMYHVGDTIHFVKR